MISTQESQSTMLACYQYIRQQLSCILEHYIQLQRSLTKPYFRLYPWEIISPNPSLSVISTKIPNHVRWINSWQQQTSVLTVNAATTSLFCCIQWQQSFTFTSLIIDKPVILLLHKNLATSDCQKWGLAHNKLFSIQALHYFM